MIQRYIAQMSQRERLLVIIGIGIVAALLLYQLVLLPYLAHRARLQTRLYTLDALVEQVRQLGDEYQILQSRQDEFVRQIEEDTEGFRLFTFLEEVAFAHQLRTTVSAMKPGQRIIDEGILESTVDMTLERISLTQLVAFLAQIEYSDRKVTVRNISIYRNQNDLRATLLDVTLKAAVVTVNEAAIAGD